MITHSDNEKASRVNSYSSYEEETSHPDQKRRICLEVQLYSKSLTPLDAAEEVDMLSFVPEKSEEQKESHHLNNFQKGENNLEPRTQPTTDLEYRFTKPIYYRNLKKEKSFLE